MKKITTTAVAIVFLMVSFTVSAQNKSFIEMLRSSSNQFNTAWLGYAPTTYCFGPRPYDTKDQEYTTLSFGGTHTWSMPSSTMIETGLFLESVRSKKERFSDCLQFFNFNIPFNFIYELPLSDGVLLLPYIGVHADWIFSAHGIKNYDTEYEKRYNVFEHDYLRKYTVFKHFILGYQLGARLKVSNIVFSFGYESMLTSLSENEDKLNSITLRVGYIF